MLCLFSAVSLKDPLTNKGRAVPELDSLRLAGTQELYDFSANKLDLIEIEARKPGLPFDLRSQVRYVFRFDSTAKPENRVSSV